VKQHGARNIRLPCVTQQQPLRTGMESAERRAYTTGGATLAHDDSRML
jgi:hypothetical protein